MRSLLRAFVIAIGLRGAVCLAADAQLTTVPISIDQIFGSRPVVEATLNGLPFRLVIHANAGSYLQVNHAEASKVGVRDLVHQGAYGIEAPGKVSDLGRDDGFLNELAIKSWRAAAVPVAVFEVPAGGSQGMLGLPWLRASGAILSFAKRELVLPGAGFDRAAMAADLVSQGYAARPMTRDPEDGRYLVEASIGAARSMMVVSTVAGVDLDTAFVSRAGATLGAVVGSYGGPSGATGKVYETAQLVSIGIGDWTSDPEQFAVEDTYNYSHKPRPADPALARGGALGADFLIRYGAVVDFGASTLYLKRR